MTPHSRGRWAPFWVSLTFAAVFVLLRIAYRIVFGSFSWPAVLQAASMALPFAVVIVVCGFLSALVDVRKILPAMSALRHGRSIGTALAIALSSYPNLIHQVKQLDSARKLRGIRSRSTFLVPLLEHTIERAVALAAAMDVRGFGSTRRSADSDPVTISFRNYSLDFGRLPVLTDITCEIEPGALTAITGKTGSGKSALLESIAGLSQHFHNGHTSGSLQLGSIDRITTPPRDTAGRIGFVPQNVRLGFAAATAREELAFGLRVAGFSRKETNTRVDELISRFALSEFADRPIEFLSSGEATRVAIAAALALEPQILLLDEPLADLDTDSRLEITTLIQELHREGMTIVIAEHHTDALSGLTPRWLSIDSGTLSKGVAPITQAPLAQRSLAVVGSDPVLEVKDLAVSHAGLSGIAFTAHVGEILAITGPNGVGKSSLLSAIAAGYSEGTPAARAQSISLVPENVSSLFITETLAEELARADKVAGHAGSGLAALTFWSILASTHESSELLATHPRDLSAGTQVALAISLQLSWKPGVILVDEPTRGLDEVSREAMAEVLRCVAETGTAVIIATHDHDFVSTLGCTVLSLQKDALLPVEVSA